MLHREKTTTCDLMQKLAGIFDFLLKRDNLLNISRKGGIKVVLCTASEKFPMLSFHIGSGVENCRPMAQSLENARKLLDYGRMLGHPVDILDIGGGFMATAPNEFLKVN